MNNCEQIYKMLFTAKNPQRGVICWDIVQDGDFQGVQNLVHRNPHGKRREHGKEHDDRAQSA